MMAITFISAPHFRWPFADAHCSRMRPGTHERIDFIYLRQQSSPCENMESFCTLYDFLSRIIPFGDAELEARYIFFRHVLHPLREALRIETPATAQGSGVARDRKHALLSEIVEQMNGIFEGELSDADVISYAEGVRDKVLEDGEVALQARNNASL